MNIREIKHLADARLKLARREHAQILKHVAAIERILGGLRTRRKKIRRHPTAR